MPAKRPQPVVKAEKAKVYWVSLSDEPGFEFTAQYVQLVRMLREEIEMRPNHIQIPTMDSMTYEEDHYHLLPSSRMETAKILAARIR